jgi:diguanylate cyclase (GGDEF)-like protein/PAS domain S-box-containing protein
MTVDPQERKCLLVAKDPAIEAAVSEAFAGLRPHRIAVARVDLPPTDILDRFFEFYVVDSAIADPLGTVEALHLADPDGFVIGIIRNDDTSTGNAMLKAGAATFFGIEEIAGTESRLAALASALIRIQTRRRDHLGRLERELLDARDSRERIEAQSADMIAMAEDLERAYRAADSATRDARSTAQRLEGVINTVVDSVLIVRGDGRIEQANPAAETMFGRPRERIAGSAVGTLLPGLDLEHDKRREGAAPRTKSVFEWEAVNERSVGFPVELSVGAFRAADHELAICVVRDIAERKRIEKRIRDLALIDALTGLSNRSAFRTRLDDAIARSQRSGRPAALILMDLNKFKAVNDNFGHPAGDALLIEVAKLLRANTRKTDTVARLGGDEFAIILTDLQDMDVVQITIGRIVEAVCTPMVIDGSLIKVGTSLGVAFYPHDDEDADGLIRKADLALYQAKATGEDTYRIFDRELQRAARGRKTIEDDLRLAIVRQSFLLHFQPQIDVASHTLIGAEALIRWQHPTRGLLRPLEFIPIAEATGLVGAIGDWVLELSCRQMAAWDAQGAPVERIAVNVSLRQFRDDSLIRKIRDCLAATGLAPDRLELEITETALDRDVDTLIASLAALRDMGVRLAMDDFGAGYASLSYLRRFPVERLKIDQSFVRNIGRSASDAAFPRAIIGLAQGLGLDVLAEGIETEAEANFFVKAGCPKMQGHLFAKPMPVDEFAAWRTAYQAARREAS